MVDLQPLIHTHKGLSISLRNFTSNPWEREERRNPNLLALQMGREISRKRTTALSITQLMLPTVFIVWHRNFRCLGPELLVQGDLTIGDSVQADLTVVDLVQADLTIMEARSHQNFRSDTRSKS